MWRFALAHLLARPARTAALLLGIVVACASFTVLTGASETGRLEVRGTVARSFRTSYDILVRPRGSRTDVERASGLIRPGALSGIAGGITLRQWRRVLGLPGVAVAAPVATVGYALPSLSIPVDLTGALGSRSSGLFRVDVERRTDRGLTRHQDTAQYAYLTRRDLTPAPAAATPDKPYAPQVRTGDGSYRPICDVAANENAPQSEFDPINRGAGDLLSTLVCSSLRSGVSGQGFTPFARGHGGALIPASLPFVIAAIDPDQEARLTGLPRAVVSGRMLRSTDRTSHRTLLPQVPVLAGTRPTVDEDTSITVHRATAAETRRFERASGVPATKAALRAIRGPVIQQRSFTAQETYDQTGITGQAQYPPAVTTYWNVGPTRYDRIDDTTLRPRTTRNGSDAWESQADLGYVPAPLSADDQQFRRLTPSRGAAAAQLGTVFPALRTVGTFDSRRIGGDHLVDAALGTAVPPGLAPADRASQEALGGRDLLPNANIAGYATQAPLLLTTLASLPAFEGANFTPNQGRAPISAIRVRVADVHGIDQASRERVRQAAQAITETTGLDVDLTIGSSASLQRIDLPAGTHGRPALALTEPWVRKGVGLTVLEAVDTKSVALFVLILAVCALFVANATAAAVAARRTELAVLSALGWSPGQLFGSVLSEVALVGLLAGVLGGALALAASALLDVAGPVDRAALAVPSAVLLSAVAAGVPALRAARARPAEALRPAVADARRAHSPKGIGSLARINLGRTPGRTLLAASSLALGVASLTVLLAITLAFRGAAVGSVLGDAVAVQVRAVDYIAVGVTVLLGALAVADVLYLNLRARAGELAVLRATGWSDHQVQRLVCSEGALIGLLGGSAGALAGLGVAWALTGPPPAGAVLAAVIGVVGGVLVAALASLLPATLAARRSLTEELTLD